MSGLVPCVVTLVTFCDEVQDVCDPGIGMTLPPIDFSSDAASRCRRWFKLGEGGDQTPVELGDRVRQVGGTLIIREARVEDSGKYLCVVNNSVGAESVETVLTVTGGGADGADSFRYDY